MDRLTATIVQTLSRITHTHPLILPVCPMSSSAPLPPLFDEFPPTSTEAWKEKIQADLGSSNVEEVLTWDSIEGVSLPGYLRREDLDKIAHLDPDASASPLASDDGTPANDWQVRQNIAHPDPSQANRLAQSAVRGGATALGLVRPSFQAGRDFGLTTETIDDLRTVLENLPLDEISLHLDGGAAAPMLLATLQALMSDHDFNDLKGSVGHDPIAALATGTVRDTEKPFDLAGDLVAEAPSSVRSLTIDLRPYHNAGASTVQELAFGLGALSDTFARLLEQGYDLSSLLPRLQFTTAVSTSYFVEIAKLRAFRLLVPQVVEAFAAEAGQNVKIEPTDLFVQAETSHRTETIYDPYVNMLRATTEGMAAVIGGCDVLSVRPYDASLRTEDPFGTRIARNVQHILREEAHINAVADPSAGSYYLEAATDQLAQRAWDTFQDLEANDGLLHGLQEGRVQQQIAAVRNERQNEVDTRKRVLVGTNHYPALDETRRDDLEEPPSFASSDNSVPLDAPSLDNFRTALSDGHSVSEILATLAEGKAPIDPLPRLRVSETLEEIRLRTERHTKETGHTPTVFLAPLGPAKTRSARANFARNVLGVAGFDVVEPLRFDTPDAAAEAAAEADADIVVLCSADSEYPELTPALRQALEDHGLSSLLVVAGNPDKIDADLPADDFIHIGNLLREKLEALQDRLDIPE